MQSLAVAILVKRTLRATLKNFFCAAPAASHVGVDWGARLKLCACILGQLLVPRACRGFLWAHRLGRRVINFSVSSGRSDPTVETQALVTKLGGRCQEVITRPSYCSEFVGFLPKDESILFTSTFSVPSLCLQDDGQVGAYGPEDSSRRLLRCKRRGAFFPQVKERRRHSGVSKESAEPREMHRAPCRKCRQLLNGSAPHLPAVATPNRTPLVVSWARRRLATRRTPASWSSRRRSE